MDWFRPAFSGHIGAFHGMVTQLERLEWLRVKRINERFFSLLLYSFFLSFKHNFRIIFIVCSDFIWDFGKLPFPTHLGKYIIKIGKIRAKIHEIGKIKAIFGLGMTPIYGLKNGQIKSLVCVLIV